ncbi:MAG TPA: hypothetical protein VN625_04285, partial [Desulfuromonadaceae bacterium]|nr:hypothetical protein [Desulfuromonadaceae bacterium]
LLAVSAERIKKIVWQELGIDDNRRWRGQIYLAMRPARTVDENVTIISSRFNGAWNYRVELPDVISRLRLTRALSAAVLLELANRNAGDHSAELPDWLVDGFAEQLLTSSMAGFFLSAPPVTEKNGIPEKRINAAQKGWNLMKDAHRILQTQDALTFEQLSWPSENQLSGNDGGVYRASAQLFVNELLELKNGPAEIRTMVQTLPRFYNWQMAFRSAFHDDFPDPVDLEKWWSLRTVDFVAFDIGPTWTAGVSRQKLDAVLSVPVEYRSSSNNVPTHAEVSIQTIIRNFEKSHQTQVLSVKLRDLQLAELRMAPRFAQLAEQYRKILADYLGVSPAPKQVVLGKNYTPPSARAVMHTTLMKLDAADADRRAIETAMERSGGEMPSLTGRNSNL